jgi:two-component system, LytTR family, response regulator
MRCIIIDDEPLARELLEDNIRHVPRLQLAASCRNAGEAMQIMQEQAIDLVFCDIKMPAINGLQFVRSMQQKPMIIFVTAYQEFAFDGFELDVLDYLLKPVPLERFLKACNKAIKQYDDQKNLHTRVLPQNDHLFVYADYTLIRLNHQEITHIEGLKDYVKLYRSGQPKPLLSRITIKALEEQLPSRHFFRTHKSFIVNLNYVQSIGKGRIKLNGAEVPYGESYKDVIVKMTGKAL